MDRGNPEECEDIPHCPICGSNLIVAHYFAKMKICSCKSCGTTLSIPDEAWDRVRLMNQKRA